jgi:hypothetical protein
MVSGVTGSGCAVRAGVPGLQRVRVQLGVLGAVLDDLGCPRGILRPVAHCA